MTTLPIQDRQIAWSKINALDLFQQAPIAIYTTDVDGYINYFNTASVELWGRAPELGKDLWCGSWKIYQPDGITSLPLDECPMAVLLKEGRKMPEAEIIIERPDGKRINVLPHPEALYDQDGTMIGALNMMVDITDRRTIENTQAKFEAIVQSSTDGIISKNLDGIITSWNASAERIFGYKEKEMIGKPILTLIPEERKEEEQFILNRIRKGERVETFETQRLTKYGQLIDISLTISPIRNGSGHIIGASKIVRDITEIRKLEQRKDDFIRMASHELKTPITSINGYTQLLLNIYNEPYKEQHFHSDPIVKSSLETIARQVSKITRLIAELLDLSRIESAKLELVITEFKLENLLEEMVHDARHTTRQHVILFESEYKGMISGDQERLGQVFTNIIGNAIKYSRDADRIEVYLTKDKGFAVIRVKDYGIGIDPEDLTRIFERFYRAEGKSEQTYPGFGIGLFIAKEIVELHKGLIEVSSQKSKWSVFTVKLPLESVKKGE